MADFLEDISFTVQMNIVGDEQIRKIRDQANIEIDILGKQQGLKIIVVGGEQNAQAPQDHRYVLSFQNTLPFNYFRYVNSRFFLLNHFELGSREKLGHAGAEECGIKIKCFN